MLTLPIKREWYDLILSGEKKEEYREITKYYGSRFASVWGDDFSVPKAICFRNGYRSDSPHFTALCTLDIGTGRPEWGAEQGKEYFRLRIRKIED